MKDLGNNLIGIEAAKWLEKNDMELLSLIGELAEENILFVNQKDVFLDGEIVKKPDFFIAEKWAKENKDKIQKRMEGFQVTLAKHVVSRRDTSSMLQNRASISKTALRHLLG